MEIERKWMVTGWPRGLEPEQVYRMEALQGGPTALVLCFKGAPDPSGMSRQEIETEIDADLFAKLEDLIGKPLIRKERRTYALPDGLHLEVNEVDPGLPGHFMYAEVEYPDEETARCWTAADVGLESYLTDEVTGRKGASMGEYWEQTRG